MLRECQLTGTVIEARGEGMLGRDVCVCVCMCVCARTRGRLCRGEWSADGIEPDGR
jgi:hypothetical protein